MDVQISKIYLRTVPNDPKTYYATKVGENVSTRKKDKIMYYVIYMMPIVVNYYPSRGFEPGTELPALPCAPRII